MRNTILNVLCVASVLLCGCTTTPTEPIAPKTPMAKSNTFDAGKVSNKEAIQKENEERQTFSEKVFIDVFTNKSNPIRQ